MLQRRYSLPSSSDTLGVLPPPAPSARSQPLRNEDAPSLLPAGEKAGGSGSAWWRWHWQKRLQEGGARIQLSGG